MYIIPKKITYMYFIFAGWLLYTKAPHPKNAELLSHVLKLLLSIVEVQNFFIQKYFFALFLG